MTTTPEGASATAVDPVVATIRQLEDRRYRALREVDIATLDELLSPDLVYTHSNAQRDTKQSFLQKVADGVFRYGEIRHPEERIIVARDCAIVCGDMLGEVVVSGEPRTLNNAVLAVWSRDSGSWQLIGFQSTPRPIR